MTQTSSKIIVFGNEKGGSGKSTAAVHAAIGLLRMGYRVGSIDLDPRQGTFSRYLANRTAWMEANATPLPCPIHLSVAASQSSTISVAHDEDAARLSTAINTLAEKCDFLVIDTPGTDSFLNRLAHSYADVLVTPINDSFIDLDLLARIDPETLEIKAPSVYSDMVWEQRKLRMLRDKGSIDWIVMRNRLSHVDAKNKRDIADLVERLEQRLRFRTTPGFGERVIFRELFLKGLTLLDIRETGDAPLSLSQVAARQEVRSLIDAIAPEKLVPKPAMAPA